MKKLFCVLTLFYLASSCSTDDNSAAIPATLDFNPVFSFVSDSLDLDMTNNLSSNSIYITYSDIDLIDIYREKVLKFDITTSLQTEITHSDGTESRQIEVIGNDIYSLSYLDMYKFDSNLNNILEIPQTSYKGISRLTKYNNNIILLSNQDFTSPGSSNMELLLFDVASESYLPFATFPNGYRSRGDGNIINNKLYIFGGNDGSINYGEINIFDINNNNWTQQAIPFGVYESFTSVYNNSVIVAGNKNEDFSGAFIAIYDSVTNNFATLNTSLNLDAISIRGITVINDEIYIAYADYSATWPANITIKVEKASL